MKKFKVSQEKDLKSLVISKHHPFFKACLSEMEGEMRERTYQILENGFFLFHQRTQIRTLTIHIGPIAFDLHPKYDDKRGENKVPKFLRKFMNSKNSLEYNRRILNV